MAATSNVCGYREIVDSQESPTKWKEISVSAGIGSWTGKEVKLLDTAGGYSYANSDQLQSVTRNRFLYWRVTHDVLELVELSLDFNLIGNQLRVLFHGVPLVSVQVHETPSNVMILVITALSAHRLLFPHPNSLQSHDVHRQSVGLSLSSIFTDASIRRIDDEANVCVFNGAGAQGSLSYTVVVASSFLTVDGFAVFSVALHNGGLLIIRMPPYGSQGHVVQHEIKQSVMARLWNGFVPSIIRGGQDASGDIIAGLCMHPVHSDVAVVGVSRNNKLRVWSASTYECLVTSDVLDHVPDVAVGVQLGAGATHLIRKSVDAYGQSLVIAVFLSFGDRSQFVIYELVHSGSQYEVKHMATVFGPQGSLIDYYVTSTHLWSLWYNTAGETVAKYACFARDSSRTFGWIDAVMMTPLKDHLEVSTSTIMDPRELYIGQIFYPERFSVSVILKALNIFRRTPDANYLGEAVIPLRELKQEVSEAVQAEIRRAVSEYEMEEGKYVELQTRQWARFYSICVQYQQRSLKSLGLLADPETGMVGIVTKTGVNYIESCFVIDRLYLDPPVDPHNASDFLMKLPELNEDDVLCGDIDLLMNCLKLTSQALKGEPEHYYEQDLYFAVADPVRMATDFADYILRTAKGDVVNVIIARLQEMHSFIDTVETLILLLDVSRLLLEASSDREEDEGNAVSYDISHMFSSSVGLAILCRCIHRTAETRLLICRDVLVLLMLARRLGTQITGSNTLVNTATAELVSKIGVLVRSYYMVKWSAQTVALPVSSSLIESTAKQLEVLNMGKKPGVSAVNRLGDRSVTLLELFLLHNGGIQMRDQLKRCVLYDADRFDFWNSALPSIITIIHQLIWPSFPASRFLFPQTLVSQCQFLAVQDYVRLTQPWCQCDAASRSLILAHSYLHSNELYKALECFKAATDNLMEEEFLINLMSRVSSTADPRHLEVLYYLQVIHLVELFELHDLVVTLVKLAIDMAELDDPNVPTLWSKLFKYQLELGHSEEAYHAMLNNPDESRRKDCLRQFLVILCERNELGLLIDLPYRDDRTVMEGEVVSIMESRARSLDITKHKYYDLLYAFHIKRSNYRIAGSIMYEYASKLGSDVPGLKGLQGQAKCLLAAMNALRLGDPKYAWIIKPATARAQSDDDEHSDDELITSPPPKRACQPQRLTSDVPYKRKRKVEVLELKDLEKEYALVHACLELAQKSSVQRSHVARSATRTQDADEIVGLLVDAGLYDKAAYICQLFSLKMDSLFSSLSVRCVQSSQQSYDINVSLADTWAWIQHNDLPTACSKDAGVNGVADSAWQLLQTYLERYTDDTSRYYRCVAVKLFQHGFALPSWFLASYKRVNAAELLRLYLDYNLLSEAADLATEYIKATLGAGKEYFGLTDFVHSGASPTWLPYTSLDQLLAMFKDVDFDYQYIQLCDMLNATLKDYFSKVNSATQAAVHV